MKVAIMQPYLFPYIGYFQLINAVDTFVFLDDVNYIKKGWINRNRILVNGKESMFTVPVKKASQNKLINEIEVVLDGNWIEQFYKTLEQNYSKAPNFDDTFLLIQTIFNSGFSTISDLVIASVSHICLNLGMEKNFQISSELYSETQGQEKSDRLINITKQCKYNHYINPIGGLDLYSKQDFKKENIDLFFLKSDLPEYKQFNTSFVPGLSIIDIMMFNEPEQIRYMLNQYTLI
jgi:hypothetical protein